MICEFDSTKECPHPERSNICGAVPLNWHNLPDRVVVFVAGTYKALGMAQQQLNLFEKPVQLYKHWYSIGAFPWKVYTVGIFCCEAGARYWERLYTEWESPEIDWFWCDAKDAPRSVSSLPTKQRKAWHQNEKAKARRKERYEPSTTS